MQVVLTSVKFLFTRLKFDLIQSMLRLNNVSAAVEADEQKEENLFSATGFKCAAC